MWLEIGQRRIAGVFEEGRSREDKLSAVQYVRFPLGAAAAGLVGGSPLRLVSDHPHYRAMATIPPEVQTARDADLRP